MLAVAGRSPEGSIGGRSAVIDGRRLLITTFPWSRKDGGPLMQRTTRTRLRCVTTSTTTTALAKEGRISPDFVVLPSAIGGVCFDRGSVARLRSNPLQEIKNACRRGSFSALVPDAAIPRSAAASGERRVPQSPRRRRTSLPRFYGADLGHMRGARPSARVHHNDVAGDRLARSVVPVYFKHIPSSLQQAAQSRHDTLLLLDGDGRCHRRGQRPSFPWSR
jgi:hypothetical protein